MYSLQYRPQMNHSKCKENGGRRPKAAAPHFLDIGYGPSVACTVGWTWLMYSLCMAHVWLMYDLHMAHIALRSAISSATGSARGTDHEGTLTEKSVICCHIALYKHLWVTDVHILSHMSISVLCTYLTICSYMVMYMTMYGHIWSYMSIYGDIM